MSSDPSPGSGQESTTPPAFGAGALPRLGADGRPVDAGGRPHAAEQDDVELVAAPSPLWPAVTTAAGIALSTAEVVRLVQRGPEADGVWPLNGLFLAASLALGGFSLVRLLQLHRLAAARAALHRSDSEGARHRVPWLLEDAHTGHAVWVIAVGGALALVGLLGLWSLAEGGRVGIEPGWPLLLIGAVIALVAHLARTRTTTLWERGGETPRRSDGRH